VRAHGLKSELEDVLLVMVAPREKDDRVRALSVHGQPLLGVDNGGRQLDHGQEGGVKLVGGGVGAKEAVGEGRKDKLEEEFHQEDSGNIDIGERVILTHSNGEIFANDRMLYKMAHYAEAWATRRLRQMGAYIESVFGAKQCLHLKRSIPRERERSSRRLWQRGGSKTGTEAKRVGRSPNR